MTDNTRRAVSDDAIRSMLARRAGPPAPPALDAQIIAIVRATTQVRQGPIGRPASTPWRLMLVAAALVVIALVLAIVSAGHAIPTLRATKSTSPSATRLGVVPSSVSPSSLPSVAAVFSDVAAPSDSVAFVRLVSDGTARPGTSTREHSEIWVVRQAGEGAHALVPGLVGCQDAPSWSQAGTRLLFDLSPPEAAGAGSPSAQVCLPDNQRSRIFMTDAAGSTPVALETHCDAPCRHDGRPNLGPDDRSVLFVRSLAGVDELAILDLATGAVTELASTRLGGVWGPAWSPDGAHIAFGVETVAVDQRFPDGQRRVLNLYIVDRDGGSLRQVASGGTMPRWSADGKTIVYESFEPTIVPGAPGAAEREYQDIWTIAPDGTSQKRLTTDQYSSLPMWTTDGRVRFLRTIRDDGKGGPPRSTGWWLMDADGGNPHALGLAAIITPLRGDYDPGIPSWPGP